MNINTKHHTSSAFQRPSDQGGLSKGARQGGLRGDPILVSASRGGNKPVPTTQANQSHSAVTPHSSIAANAIPGPFGASRVRVNGNYHQAMNSSNTGGAHNDYMQGYVNSTGRITNNNSFYSNRGTVAQVRPGPEVQGWFQQAVEVTGEPQYPQYQQVQHEINHLRQKILAKDLQAQFSPPAFDDPSSQLLGQKSYQDQHDTPNFRTTQLAKNQNQLKNAKTLFGTMSARDLHQNEIKIIQSKQAKKVNARLRNPKIRNNNNSSGQDTLPTNNISPRKNYNQQTSSSGHGTIISSNGQSSGNSLKNSGMLQKNQSPPEVIQPRVMNQNDNQSVDPKMQEIIRNGQILTTYISSSRLQNPHLTFDRSLSEMADSAQDHINSTLQPETHQSFYQTGANLQLAQYLGRRGPQLNTGVLLDCADLTMTQNNKSSVNLNDHSTYDEEKFVKADPNFLDQYGNSSIPATPQFAPKLTNLDDLENNRENDSGQKIILQSKKNSIQLSQNNTNWFKARITGLLTPSSNTEIEFQQQQHATHTRKMSQNISNFANENLKIQENFLDQDFVQSGAAQTPILTSSAKSSFGDTTFNQIDIQEDYWDIQNQNQHNRSRSRVDEVIKPGAKMSRREVLVVGSSLGYLWNVDAAEAKVQQLDPTQFYTQEQLSKMISNQQSDHSNKYEYFSWNYQSSAGTPELHTDIQIQIFYDPLCIDSKTTHFQLKEVLEQFAGPVNGTKKYKDLVSIEVVPFALPYHQFSFELTKVIPYLQQTCAGGQKVNRCQDTIIERYAELCFDNIDRLNNDKNKSLKEFIEEWSLVVSKHFAPNVKQTDIKKLYQNSKDSYQTSAKARSTWKYGAQQGVSETPQAYINGHKLLKVPEDEQEWTKLLNTLIKDSKNLKNL